MASPQQPAPPTNPFDGFNAHPNAQQHQLPQQPQQPPQQHQQQQMQIVQHQMSPANQWSQQLQQPPPQQPQQQPQQMMGIGQQQPQQPTNTAHPFAPVAAPAPFGMPQQPVHGGGGMMSMQMQQQPAPNPTQPFGMAPQQQQQPALNYAHPQSQQPQQQQMVAVAPNNNAMVASPWSLGPTPPAVASPAPATATAADPFGIFGAPAAAQPLQSPQNQNQQLVQQQPAQQQQQAFFSQQQLQTKQQQQNPYAQTTPQNLQKELQGFNLQKQNESLLPDESEDEGLAMIDVDLDNDDNDNETNLEDRKNDGEFFGRDNATSSSPPKKHSKSRRSSRGENGGGAQSWDRNPDIAPPPPPTPGRNHAVYLSQHSAPALSSPLPTYALVHHSGYVLSRISFRTVLMRKWKQTFWIQYGPTQLLFFRTFSDYNDWLNNPYHTLKAREFLVKLRVDFVSDLKKSSVMGYQVTQVRRKPYGKNVMQHFKLERWMDYGPTIAAAFAAREDEVINSPRNGQGGRDEDGMNTTNDVSSLRKIILGCMRNARDAALVVAKREQDSYEAVGYQGRYEQEHTRDRIQSGSGNMGYHQAFSAESSERRRGEQGIDRLETQESLGDADGGQENSNAAAPEPAPPVIDLLG